MTEDFAAAVAIVGNIFYLAGSSLVWWGIRAKKDVFIGVGAVAFLTGVILLAILIHIANKEQDSPTLNWLLFAGFVFLGLVFMLLAFVL